MKTVEIKDIRGADVIPHLHWLEDIPKRKQVESEPLASIIVNVLQGRYHGLLGLLDGKPCALMIYHMISDRHISIKIVLAKSRMVRFYMAFVEYLNEYRIESFEFESGHKPKLWQRLFPESIKVVRTTYMFDIKKAIEKEKAGKYDRVPIGSMSLLGNSLRRGELGDKEGL